MSTALSRHSRLTRAIEYFNSVHNRMPFTRRKCPKWKLMSKLNPKVPRVLLVKLWDRNVKQGNRMMSRTGIMQQKTQRPIIQFELSEQASDIVGAWIVKAQLKPDLCLFPSRVHTSEHISTRRYKRVLKGWVASIGLAQAAEHRGKSAFLPNKARPVFLHFFSRQCQRLVIDRKSDGESK